MKRKKNVSAPAESSAKKVAKTDEFGEYLKKDVYGTKVSVQTESDKFKVAERVGKMRARNSGIVSASDHGNEKAMELQLDDRVYKDHRDPPFYWAASPENKRRMPLVTPRPSKHGINE